MVTSLKDLEKLLKLLRKQGVTDFRHGEIELKMGDLPIERKTYAEQDQTDPENHYANFPEGMLTPEQLLFYSAGGDPDEDPENQDIAQ